MKLSLIKGKDIEQAIILVATGLGLVGLLSYTFWHTGGLLSRYIEPGALGYFAAFGVECIVVLMSYKLAKLKSNARTNWLLWCALVFALSVSAVANYSEGFYTHYEQILTWDSWQANIDWIQFVISILATALISVLVFVVSDIISSDVTTVSRRVEQIVKAEQQPEQKAEHIVPTPEHVNSKERTVHRAIRRLTEQDKPATIDNVAELAEVSRSTAHKWIGTYRNGGNND